MKLLQDDCTKFVYCFSYCQK